MNEISEKYEAIGNEIIAELFPELLNAKIAWLRSDKQKRNNGKIVFAECAKVSEKYEWTCKYDYMITVYEPNIVYFTDEQIKILLEHELMHADYVEGKALIRPHDAEEFKDIIRKYGIDWAKPADNISIDLSDIE